MIRAVLGGSFDPVHNGHLALAGRVLDDGLADRLHLIPAARNPFKDSCVARPEDRLDMVRLAFAGRDDIVVEDLELRRAGPSFTVDTLEALAARHEGDRLRLVCGADNLAGFGAWKDPDRLLALADLVVFSRPGAPVQDLPLGLAGDRVHLVSDFHHEVSSTRIRAMLAAGQPVERLVPADVITYIETHRLYHR